MVTIPKKIESERVHVDVDGQHSTIVTFDDGSEETFTGFRKIEPEDITGEQLPDGYGAVAIVKHGDGLFAYFIKASWPDTFANGLGHYYRAKAEGANSTILVLDPQWGGKIKE